MNKLFKIAEILRNWNDSFPKFEESRLPNVIVVYQIIPMFGDPPPQRLQDKWEMGNYKWGLWNWFQFTKSVAVPWAKMWIKISSESESISINCTHDRECNLSVPHGIPSKMTSINPASVNLNELPPVENLLATRAQVEKDLQLLSESFTQLKGAQANFATSIQSLESLKSSGKKLASLNFPFIPYSPF